jgi:hypothetical protein
MLNWEEIKHDCSFHLYRAKIFGGWLVVTPINGLKSLIGGKPDMQSSVTFVPDPNHQWELNQ